MPPRESDLGERGDMKFVVLNRIVTLICSKLRAMHPESQGRTDKFAYIRYMKGWRERLVRCPRRGVG